MFTAVIRGDRREKEHVSLPLVSELADVMILTSICGLGQVASNPISSVIRFFRGEVEAYLAGIAQDPRRPAKTMLKTLEGL
jgi:NADH:ubiquinone oxidoreductase subunit F (NADH-binding)